MTQQLPRVSDCHLREQHCPESQTDIPSIAVFIQTGSSSSSLLRASSEDSHADPEWVCHPDTVLTSFSIIHITVLTSFSIISSQVEVELANTESISCRCSRVLFTSLSYCRVLCGVIVRVEIRGWWMRSVNGGIAVIWALSHTKTSRDVYHPPLLNNTKLTNL